MLEHLVINKSMHVGTFGINKSIHVGTFGINKSMHVGTFGINKSIHVGTFGINSFVINKSIAIFVRSCFVIKLFMHDSFSWALRSPTRSTFS